MAVALICKEKCDGHWSGFMWNATQSGVFLNALNICVCDPYEDSSGYNDLGDFFCNC